MNNDKTQSVFKNIDIKKFFKQSDRLDYLVLKPLSHIKGNWELTWNHEKQEYIPETDSYAELLNQLIEELSLTVPPIRYHDNEDCLAEYLLANHTCMIKKVNGRWEGNDYINILEQGGFGDIDQKNLLLAIAGRIQAALIRDQLHFDDMEKSHQKVLAGVLAVILYHRM